MAIMLRDGASEGATAPRRRLALVLNGKAGALLGETDGGGSLQELAEAAGFDVTVGREDGTLPERIAAAGASGADVVAVAGGDGTVACAATVLAGGAAALGVVPCGTMNLLAKDIGMPVGDRAAAVGVLAMGRVRRIDAGEIGGQMFLCAAMLGSPARLGHHREAGRRLGNGLLGWLRFGRAALRAMRRHKRLRLVVTVDGVAHRMKTVSLTVTINALDDATGRLFGRSCLDGGELVFYAVRHRSVAGLVRLAVNTLLGRFGRDPAVRMLRGREAEIRGETAALLVLVDGEEHVLPSPIRLRVLPRALSVIGA